MTESDVEMERTRNEFRDNLLGFLIVAIMALGFFGFMALLIILA